MNIYKSNKTCVKMKSLGKTFTMDINQIKTTKTNIHEAVIRCKATITPEIKLKEEQLQN